jgi:hypothetical protein
VAAMLVVIPVMGRAVSQHQNAFFAFTGIRQARLSARKKNRHQEEKTSCHIQTPFL